MFQKFQLILINLTLHSLKKNKKYIRILDYSR